VYSIQLNNGTSGYLSFNVSGSFAGDTSEVRLNNTTDTLTVTQGDLISFIITPNDSTGGFVGGGYVLFSASFA
jgi:hypothetical protein